MLKETREKIKETYVELGDGLRDNIGLDSITKAIIIKNLLKSQKNVLALLDDKEEKLREHQDKLWKQVHGFSHDLQKEMSELIVKAELNEYQLYLYLKGKFDGVTELRLLGE